ncbi:TolC family protein [Ideonella sp.]|uniref:TolC family protein n=1 Tax=Ideonella sp. TaxID=1929293 RepID=UPI0037BEAE62
MAQPVTLAQAVDAAWRRATESAAVQGALQRAQAESAASSAWWAAPPSLEIAQRMDRGLSGTGARETEVGIAMPLWLPGQRAARQQLMATDLEVARLQGAAGRWQVAGMVQASLAEVHLRSSELVQHQTEATALESLGRDVERRVKAGELAPVDALAAQAEWLQADVRVSQAAEQLAQARLHWRSLTGLDSEPAFDDVPMASASAQTQLAEHPVLREARQRVEASARKLDLAQASRRSTPELVVRVRQDQGNSGDVAVNSWGIALRIPFGTDDRQQPLLAAALSERDLADAQSRQLQQQVAAAVEAQVLTQDALERQWRSEQRRATLLRERSDLMGKSFRAGETALPDLLRALAAAHAAEAAVQKLYRQRAQAAARHQHALGVIP